MVLPNPNNKLWAKDQSSSQTGDTELANRPIARHFDLVSPPLPQSPRSLPGNMVFYQQVKFGRWTVLCETGVSPATSYEKGGHMDKWHLSGYLIPAAQKAVQHGEEGCHFLLHDRSVSCRDSQANPPSVLCTTFESLRESDKWTRCVCLSMARTDRPARLSS